MDHHDLKASENEINVVNHSSPGKQSLLEKTNSLPDCCVGLVDANVELQKQGHGIKCETSGCKAEKLPEIERNGHVSSLDFALNNMDDQRSECGQPLDKDIYDKMNGSWLNTRENGLKFVMQAVFPDKQCKTESSSSNSTQVILPASSNDSCQETNVSIASKHSKTNAVDTSTCTDLKSNIKESTFGSSLAGVTIHLPKAEPESSKILPGKIHNSVKGSETPDNIRAMNTGKVQGMNDCGTVEDTDLLNSDSLKKKNARPFNHGKPDVLYEIDDALDVARRVAREIEQEVEASGSTSSVQGRNSETIHLSFVDSADSKRKSCLTENGSVVQQGIGQDISVSVCSTKDVDTEVVHKGNDGHHKQELSYLTSKAGGLASNKHICHHSNLDLNEDILQEVECAEQSVKEAVFNPVENVSKPTPVVAKSGIHLPMSQILKEGELGWKGSAATSAFRPTAISKSWIGSKASSGNDGNDNDGSKLSHFKGIDLNVAPVGVEYGNDMLQEKPTPAKSSVPSNGSCIAESSSQAKRFSIDLNCVDETDSFQELSLPTSSSRHFTRDFDLNNNPTSADTFVYASQPGEGTLSLRNSGLDGHAVFSVENPEKPEYRSFKSAFSAVNTFQGFSHGHTQPFLLPASSMLNSNEQMQRVTAMQPKLTYTQQPPHALIYSNGFCIDPKNSLPPALYTHGVMPYLTDPHATTVFPQVLGSGAISAFPRSQHVIQVPDGFSPSNVYNGMNAMDSRSRGANATQLSIPSTVEEQMKAVQQVAVSAMPAKRREPEGGWDSNQVCFRQVASWQ